MNNGNDNNPILNLVARMVRGWESISGELADESDERQRIERYLERYFRKNGFGGVDAYVLGAALAVKHES